MIQRVPGTPLPKVGENDVAAYVQMSRRFQEHADIEIAKENRLQASEKIWASVAHALKAVAEQRGWQHGSHTLLKDIARQVGNEMVDADATPKSIKVRDGEVGHFLAPFAQTETQHYNFYNNTADWADIEFAREQANEFIQTLDAIRDKPPGRFTPRNPTDQRRLARLLGIELTRDREEQEKQLNQLIPLGQSSDVGFSPNFGYPIPGLDDRDNGTVKR